jgi:hypothetical protein
VGRFSATNAVRYHRGQRVVCRTVRGVETGELLGPAPESSLAPEPLSDRESLSAPETLPTTFTADGTVLRAVAVEDDLLLARLEKKRHAAYAACVELLEAQGLSAVLMDVEHLFDGRSLYFYFLGPVPPEVAALTDELAATYDSVVQFQQFAETLSTGCGPGCGTEAAQGQGCGTSSSGGCATCAVAQACHAAGPAARS